MTEEQSLQPLLTETQTLLNLYGVRPSRRLGQSFMVDAGLLDRMVDYAGVTSRDTVLEVGAGLGYLTKRIAEKAGHVLALEYDPRLAQALKTLLEDYGNISIVQADFRRAQLPVFNKVVSNPPYLLSSHLVLELLRRKLDGAVLTFQDEFAEKLLASPGPSRYSRLTVASRVKWLVEPLEHVSRNAFFPTPRVDSTLVRVRPREGPLNVHDEVFFLDLVTFLFSQRRRTLRKALNVYLARRAGAPSALGELSDLPYMDLRVYELPVEGFVRLAHLLHG